MPLKIDELQKAAPGYAGCLRCQVPWLFTEHHTTWWHKDGWAGRHGCFPLCEDCWQALGTVEARLPFYRQLVVDEWEAPDEWPDVEAAVKAEAVAS